MPWLEPYAEGEAITHVAAEVWNLVGESGPDVVDRVALLDNARAAVMAQRLQSELLLRPARVGAFASVAVLGRGGTMGTLGLYQ